MKAIMTKYHGATDTKGSRVSASDGDGNRVILSWDNSMNGDENHDNAALTLCARMGWHGPMIRGFHGNQYVYVFTEYRTGVPVETINA